MRSDDLNNVLNTERGSAIIEASIGLSVICTIICGGLMVTYVVFAHFWLNWQSYETVVCLASERPDASRNGPSTLNSADGSDCARKFRLRIAKVLPIGHLDHSRFYVTHRSVGISARFLIGKNEVAHDDERLELPLIPERSK